MQPGGQVPLNTLESRRGRTKKTAIRGAVTNGRKLESKLKRECLEEQGRKKLGRGGWGLSLTALEEQEGDLRKNRYRESLKM